MSERVYHPAFGLLTDEEDIRVFERQQAEEEYNKAMEKAYEEEYNKQCQKEFDLVNHCLPAINYLEETRAFWSEKDLAEEAGVSVEDAKYVIKCMNL